MDLEKIENVFNSSYMELKKIAKELKEESSKLELEKEKFYKEIGKNKDKKDDIFSSKINDLDEDLDFLKEISDIDKKENDFLDFHSNHINLNEDEDTKRLLKNIEEDIFNNYITINKDTDRNKNEDKEIKNIIENDKEKKTKFIGNYEDKSKEYMGINLYFCLNEPSLKVGYTRVNFETKKGTKFYGELNKNFEEFLREKHGFSYCSEQLMHVVNKNFFNYLVMNLKQYSKITLLGGKQEIIVGNRFIIEIRKALNEVYDIEILEYGPFGIIEKKHIGNFYFTI